MGFADNLSTAQYYLARSFERAGLTTISQAVKAFTRRDTKRISMWKRQLTRKEHRPMNTRQLDTATRAMQQFIHSTDQSYTDAELVEWVRRDCALDIDDGSVAGQRMIAALHNAAQRILDTTKVR